MQSLTKRCTGQRTVKMKAFRILLNWTDTDDTESTKKQKCKYAQRLRKFTALWDSFFVVEKLLREYRYLLNMQSAQCTWQTPLQERANKMVSHPEVHPLSLYLS